MPKQIHHAGQIHITGWETSNHLQSPYQFGRSKVGHIETSLHHPQPNSATVCSEWSAQFGSGNMSDPTLPGSIATSIHNCSSKFCVIQDKPQSSVYVMLTTNLICTCILVDRLTSFLWASLAFFQCSFSACPFARLILSFNSMQIEHTAKRW